MESKRKNCNNIMNKFVVSVAMILVTLLFGLFFITPSTPKANAMTKENLISNSIHFVSAKTKIRRVDGYYNTQLEGHNGNTYYQFYSYLYNYKANLPNMYQELDGNNYSCDNANVILGGMSDDSHLHSYIQYDSSPSTEQPSYDWDNNYIPYNVTHFDSNASSSDICLEEVFYDEIDDGDYVLLNNYHALEQSKYDVENFYVGLGSAYDGTYETNYITDIVVEGKLYCVDGRTYTLKLNEAIPSEIGNINSPSGDPVTAEYWNQYFDLKNIRAKIDSTNTYPIENPQGKYVLNFTFDKYPSKDNISPEDVTSESFSYTFYLLDGTDYINNPTIHNASRPAKVEENMIEENKINEYFYNFDQENPYIEYDPTRYNISYSRGYNLITTEKITSTYYSSTYIQDSNSKPYPYGIISYYKNGSLFKEVYVLTNYNTTKTRVEYLFLSKNDFSLDSNKNLNNKFDPRSKATLYLSYFENALTLDEDLIQFEYKITKVLNESSNANEVTYTTTTYETTSFENYKFGSNDDNDIGQTKIVHKVDSNQYYLERGNANSTTRTLIAKVTAVPTTTSFYVTANTADSEIISNTTLAPVDQENLDENTIRYTFDGTTNILTKHYYNPSTALDETAQFSLDPTTVTPIEDGDISISYTITNGSISTITLTTTKYISNYLLTDFSAESNDTLINKIHNISQLSHNDFTYKYSVDELGIYDLQYTYTCKSGFNYIANTTTANKPILTLKYGDKIDNYYSTSTNITPTIDVDKAIESVVYTPQSGVNDIINSGDISIALWGNFTFNDGIYSMVLNQVNYVYDKANKKLTINGDVRDLNNNNSTTINGITYQIENTFTGAKLYVIYKIGTYTTKLLQRTTSIQNDQYQIVENIVETTYSELNSLANNLNSDLLTKLKAYYSNSPIKVKTRENSAVDIGKEKLHIFGSITYFNKLDNNTDNGNAKLEQYDNKRDIDFTADVTSLYFEENPTAPRTTTLDGALTLSKDLAGVSAKLLGKKEDPIRGKKAIIITDMSAIFWNNYSTLLYSTPDNYSNKISMSYIYRYPNFSFNDDGSINLCSTPEVSNKYTKDITLENTGLYEIFVFYKYANYPNNADGSTPVFYQIFSFIIDHSSPKMYVDVENIVNGQLDYSTALDSTIYTNKNIRIKWEINSYFKNDVYIDINKEMYVSATGNYSYDARFKNSETSMIDPKENGKLSYIDDVTLFTSDNEFYYVYIKKQPNALSSVTLDGNYTITLHYGAKGIATTSTEFVIDTMDISGLEIKPVVRNNDGTYFVSNSTTFDGQIINTDFTFRYSEKASKAKIFTYYNKIELNNASSNAQIVNLLDNNEIGITTKFELIESNMASGIGTPYQYNYDKGSNVSSSNFLTSNSSCIYLFSMIDEAGNECRYIVFYDTTTPRFLYNPMPNNSNHIINDSTKVIWGDYKAIRIQTNGLHLDKTITNVSKDYIQGETQSDVNYKLSTIASYINTHSSSLFNGTKIKNINNEYYILVPITDVTVEDVDFNIDVTPNTFKSKLKLKDTPKYNEIYLLPNDIEESLKESNNITIKAISESPIYVVSDSYTTATETNSYNDNIIRYFSLTYKINESSTEQKTIYGLVGEGTYYFNISDKLRNKSSGMLWMNLDKTQTFANGIFDYSDNIQNAINLTGATGTYAVSKLFISSLPAKEKEIDNYILTYEYFPYDLSQYDNYTIDAISYFDKYVTNTDSDIIPDSLTVDGLESYLIIKLTPNANLVNGEPKVLKMRLTDELGNPYPQHSYPYSFEGASIVNGHIYDEGTSNYTDKDGRIYSLPINPTTDTDRKKNVTQEGLYIFKRKYTSSTNLGNDSLIVYRTYYVDRSGIINIKTSNNNADKLYNIGSKINYTLGNNYTGEDADTYKKIVQAETIQNRQTTKNDQNSNADYISQNIFTTNKIEVMFNLTFDKYDFDEFYINSSDYNSSISPTIQNIPVLDKNGDIQLDDDDKPITEPVSVDINNLLNIYIFNRNYYINQLYNVDLTLKTNNETIINEREDLYLTKGINFYLKNTNNVNYEGANDDAPASENDIAYKQYKLYYGTTNPYNIYINDQAGYNKFDEDGITLISNNAQSNALEMLFYINHSAPTGNLYGKYYGSHSYEMVYDGETYNLISEYMAKGQLDPLSSTTKRDPYYTGSKTISSENVKTGYTIPLVSTNNQSLVFIFSITNDDTVAKIDEKYIQINRTRVDSKTGAKITESVFDRRNGINYTTDLVKDEDRFDNAFFSEVINGIKYYAIVVFDNNLDEINSNGVLDYKNYRLLDGDSNANKATYNITLRYVGDESYYVGGTSSDKFSFYETTYTIEIDREKPMYNLTKLMALDKYVYNPLTNTNELIDANNYESKFKSYEDYYGFYDDYVGDKLYMRRSILENYFFALDYRKDSSFVFESISELDNNRNIYIKPISKDSYKFSVTIDDYRAYYKSTYLSGHQQFTPSSAKVLTSEHLAQDDPIASASNGGDSSKMYFQIPFSLDYIADNKISAEFLVNENIFKKDSYYEIIERDEAGNYRVYAVYIPDNSDNGITYQYKKSVTSTPTEVPISSQSDPRVSSSGMDLQILNYKTKDNFLKAIINIVTEKNKINHTIEVISDPISKQVKVYINRSGISDAPYDTYSFSYIDNDGYANDALFKQAINEILNTYYEKINDKTNKTYYSEYGYNAYITIVDRLGIKVNSTSELLDYKIDYAVAGSTLSPEFVKYTESSFKMILHGQKGSTYLENVYNTDNDKRGITVYKYNKGWNLMIVDNSPKAKSFDLTNDELKEYQEYIFNRGVYKFVFRDNFDRETIEFYEYGISSSQTGGSLKYSGTHKTLTDGYVYSANEIQYSYDNNVYKVFVKFIGSAQDETTESDYVEFISTDNKIIYDSSSALNGEYYGISSVTSGNITTIIFSGVKNNLKNNGTTDLSKYEIKTILASNSENYTWGAEEYNKDIFVYDKKIALYTAIPNVSIRNTSGNILDTSQHLNLTEDFDLITTWGADVKFEERINFNPRIILTHTYIDNGVVRTYTSTVSSGTRITKAGEYEAYVVNDLGMESKKISFSRGDGQISMYAVYAVDSDKNTETKLTPTSYVTLHEDNKVIYTYYTLNKYFNYKDLRDGTKITINNYSNYFPSELESDVSLIVNSNMSMDKYLDLRVNSNLSIFTEISEIGDEEGYDPSGANGVRYPYVLYEIYSKSTDNVIYTYRYVKVVFLPSTTSDKLVDVTAFNANETNNLAASGKATIMSTANRMVLKFSFVDEDGNKFVPNGDTLYIDRYYNGNLAETQVFTMSENSTVTYAEFSIITVGLHEFTIRDLAGRTHVFAENKTKLSVYMVNQILYTVNDKEPINNQIFNNDVRINIISKLSEIPLYDTNSSLFITVTHNGISTVVGNNGGVLTFSEPGSYSVKMSANTILANTNPDVTDASVMSVYNFVIIKPNIAQRSFNISKGTGFIIEKIVKIVGSQRYDLTDTYEEEESLIWLQYADNKGKKEGNSIWDITLKKYNEVSNTYDSFSFKVWINDENPIILSNIPEGTSSKENIIINYNAAQIYSQVGNAYITVNGVVVVNINENSSTVVDTISISEKGSHMIKIYKEDGTLISSYKFVKTEPLNNVTKIILICAAIGVVIVVVLFFLLRRKGKYR